jgi:hypothetical protein
MAYNSRRFYAIAFIEGDSTNTHFELLEQILDDNGYEYRYAMQDQIDAILDLKIGERHQMKFNRDNEDSDGFIKRIEFKVNR